MKLNKIASALAVSGLLVFASSSVWADLPPVYDVVTGALIAAPTALEIAAYNALVVNAAAAPGVVLTDVLGTPAAAGRTDISNGVTKKVSVFATPTPVMGSATASPVQGTLGGPGGVSGLVVGGTATTTYSTTLATNYLAATAVVPAAALGNVYSKATTSGATAINALTGSIVGGVTLAADTTVAASTALLAGDKIIVAKTTTVAAGTRYMAGTILGGVSMAADGTVAATTTILAGDTLIQNLAIGSTATGSVIGGGIKYTDHDFVNKITTNQNGSTGLCTYCHTPHKASSTLLLWNHTMSANNFAWEVAATTAGTALPGFAGGSKGPSAKCQACHDGTVSIGDIGWFNGGVKTGTATVNGSTMAANWASKLIGTATGGLQGVHPVAVPYPLNGAPNVYNGSTTGARLATADFVVDPTANNIRLYSDIGGGEIVGKVTPGKSGIECTSCHDPHNKAATDRLFLRGKLVGSSVADGYLCVQCHTK